METNFFKYAWHFLTRKGHMLLISFVLFHLGYIFSGLFLTHKLNLEALLVITPVLFILMCMLPTSIIYLIDKNKYKKLG